MRPIIDVARAFLVFVLFAAFAGLSFALAIELTPLMSVAAKARPAEAVASRRPAEVRESSRPGEGRESSRPGEGRGPISTSDPDDISARKLLVPVEGYDRSMLRDNFDERRGMRRHEALDIMAPRGTPVLAVDDGRVAKLFRSLAGGLTVYQFDRDEKYAYYYAHLDRYADDLKEGTPLKRGEVLGYVGSTGNAPAHAPHLHFTVFRLGPEKKWWKGEAVNPYPLFVEAKPPAR